MAGKKRLNPTTQTEGKPTLLDEALDQLEDDPRFTEAMRKSEHDIRAGRLVSLEEIEERLRSRPSR
jgi:hypothetical protein